MRAARWGERPRELSDFLLVPQWMFDVERSMFDVSLCPLITDY
jgi:hypothetical protein